MIEVTVQVQSDHLQRMARVKKPIIAVAELIWNGLDADASEVSVSIDRDSLGTIDCIRVEDNGHGIDFDEARPSFENLGGSWKSKSAKSKVRQRILHGRAGKGRFRAFALGGFVEWSTTYKSNGRLLSYTIRGSAENLRKFILEDPEEVSDRATGTEVRISNIQTNFKVLDSQIAVRQLAEYFALYLRTYKDVRIRYEGVLVDPAVAEVLSIDYTLDPVTTADGIGIHGELTIIEWTSVDERELYLCDQNGIALEKTTPGIQAPGFKFTAYLKSEYIRHLDDQNALSLGDMDEGLASLLEVARLKLKAHFRERMAESAHDIVAQWRSDGVYPYENEPKDLLERTTRQVFDVCALNVHEYLPDFDTADLKSKKLSLRLLREAIEESPAVLQRILSDVLQLPTRKREELARLLEKTSLTAIINTAKTVADRLDFLAALEILVFDPESKEKLLERKQLHKILERETWIFGEEFHLSASDRSLNTVLKKHQALVREAAPGDSSESDAEHEPVADRGVVDLMLSRVISTTTPKSRHHLVVELKRPSKKIDQAVLNQVTKYARTVAMDERFRDTDTHWTFWAVSNEIDENVEFVTTLKGAPKGLIYDIDKINTRIWVKSWGQIIEACRVKLEFYQQQLEYSPDDESALSYLRETHEKYLPSALRAAVPDNSS